MRPNKFATHYVCIYGVQLVVGLGDDLGKLRNSRSVLKSWHTYECDGMAALTCSKAPYFMVLFQRDQLTHGRIGHEIMHFANCVMDFIMHKVSSQTDEPAAYLCEYITNLIYEDLKRWKASIR